MNRTPPKWYWPDVTDPLVLDAMATVPRHLFVPREMQEQAYDDIPLPIGLRQTISQPYIVALMTQALGIGAGSRVLEVGTGSGYQAAVLATIAGRVWSIEGLADLASTAQGRLRSLGYDVEVKTGDGWLGWPEHAPYDAIIVTAAAPEIPPALVQQLAEGGRLVIPLGVVNWDQVLWRIENEPDRGLQARRLADVRFVPLVRHSAEGAATEETQALRTELRRLVGLPAGNG